MEVCREVVCLENDSIVCDVIVEINYFVFFQKHEWILYKISLVSFQLDVWNWDIVNETDDLVEELVFRLIKHL